MLQCGVWQGVLSRGVKEHGHRDSRLRMRLRSGCDSEDEERLDVETKRPAASKGSLYVPHSDHMALDGWRGAGARRRILGSSFGIVRVYLVVWCWVYG